MGTMTSPTGGRLHPGAWLLVAVVVLTLTGCGLKQSTSDTNQDASSTGSSSEDPAATDPGTEDLTAIPTFEHDAALDRHLASATAAALEWQSDAVLHYVSVELPASLARDSGNEVYVFGSEQDAANWWTYSLSQATEKFVRAIIPKADFLGDQVIPISTQYWKMNFAEALQLAEANGGADFRARQPGTRATLFLSQRAPRGWLWWTVEYKAPSGELFTLLVNPNRGEVIDESGAELAPPTTDAPDETVSS
ncbi:hypothetical protein HY375_03445 [Candidatus Berkelbacteria bacterium]|nr:hypothetical protein [Candidatus Berkelbacteria bacterium]